MLVAQAVGTKEEDDQLQKPAMISLQLSRQQQLRDCLQLLRKELVEVRVKQIAYMALSMAMDQINPPATHCST